MRSNSCSSWSVSCLLPLLRLLLAVSGQTTNIVDLRHSFAEELPNGTQIADIRDLLRTQFRRPAGAPGEFQFRSLNDRSSRLSVHPDTGVVTVRGRIDRESLCAEADTCCPGANPHCKLSLTVGLGGSGSGGSGSGGGSSNFRDILQIELAVIDINDNAPVWRIPELQLEISEHTAVGSRFSLPPAEDPDKAPENTTRHYRLLSATDPAAFRVIVEAGGPDPAALPQVFLQVNADLDRETLASHQVVVLAVDGAAEPLTGSVTVKISLTDINDNAPTFTHESRPVSIPESYPPHREIFRVTATDLDESDASRLTYRFSVSASRAVLKDFAVNPRTGSISAVRPLDYETRREYSIPVTVSDGKHLVETIVDVQVLNVNDNPPRIAVKSILPESASGSGGGSSSGASVLEIRENSPVGTMIATVDVKDADDKTMQESVSCFVEPSKYFGILPLYQSARHQFKIVSNAKFNRESQAVFTAEVICHDSGSPSLEDRRRLEISVADENDNPPAFRSPRVRARLPENAGPGAFVASLRADDPDAGANGAVRYSLDRASQADFAVNPDSGAVTAVRSFDRETVATVNATVFAEDSADDPGRRLTATAVLLVDIADVNDCRPELSSRQYYFLVEENSPPRTLVGRVTAADGDVEAAHRNVTFRLVTPSGAEEAALLNAPAEPGSPAPDFDIDADGGVRTSATGELDRERRAAFTFLVVADDGAGLADTAQVTVTVTDVNDNKPRWVYPSESNRALNITAHRQVGSPIAHLHAADPDNGENGTVAYSLLAPQPYDNLFVVSPEGHLSLGRPIDTAKDVGSVHRLVFNASDRGQPTPLNSIETMDVRIVEQASGLSQSARTSESNLIIIVAMVIVTLIVSVVLIGAIFCLRCRACDGLRHGSGSGRGGSGSGSGGRHRKNGRSPGPPPGREEYSPTCDYQCDSVIRPEVFPDNNYQVQMPLSPLDSDGVVRRAGVAHSDAKVLLDDAESLDSGKGCSSDNGSRTMKGPPAIKEFSATMGYDAKHARVAGGPAGAGCAGGTLLLPRSQLQYPQHHHQQPHQFQQPMSTFRYSVSQDPMTLQSMARPAGSSHLHHYQQMAEAGCQTTVRPGTAVHFQQRSDSALRSAAYTALCRDDSAALLLGGVGQQRLVQSPMPRPTTGVTAAAAAAVAAAAAEVSAVAGSGASGRSQQHGSFV